MIRLNQEGIEWKITEWRALTGQLVTTISHLMVVFEPDGFNSNTVSNGIELSEKRREIVHESFTCLNLYSSFLTCSLISATIIP